MWCSKKNILLRHLKLFSRLENIFSGFDNLFSRLGYIFSKFENSFVSREKYFILRVRELPIGLHPNLEKLFWTDKCYFVTVPIFEIRYFAQINKEKTVSFAFMSHIRTFALRWIKAEWRRSTVSCGYWLDYLWASYTYSAI